MVVVLALAAVVVTAAVDVAIHVLVGALIMHVKESQKADVRLVDACLKTRIPN